METMSLHNLRYGRGTVRVAANTALLALAGALCSCQPKLPDFSYEIKAPSGRNSAIVRGFRPGGTIEGVLLISFGRTAKPWNEPNATFSRIVNGQIGWTSPNTFAVVADRLSFHGLDSEYIRADNMKVGSNF